MIYFNGHKILEDNDLQFQRNLLKNSANITVSKSNMSSASQINNMFQLFTLSETVNKGDKITISANVLSVVNGSGVNIGLWDTDITPYGDENKLFSLGGRSHATFTVTKNDSKAGIAIWASNTVTNENSEAILEKVMVQKGSVATMWLPAPEDLVTIEEFNQLKSKLGG